MKENSIEKAIQIIKDEIDNAKEEGRNGMFVCELEAIETVLTDRERLQKENEELKSITTMQQIECPFVPISSIKEKIEEIETERK